MNNIWGAVKNRQCSASKPIEAFALKLSIWKGFQWSFKSQIRREVACNSKDQWWWGTISCSRKSHTKWNFFSKWQRKLICGYSGWRQGWLSNIKGQNWISFFQNFPLLWCQSIISSFFACKLAHLSLTLVSFFVGKRRVGGSTGSSYFCSFLRFSWTSRDAESY